MQPCACTSRPAEAQPTAHPADGLPATPSCRGAAVLSNSLALSLSCCTTQLTFNWHPNHCSSMPIVSSLSSAQAIVFLLCSLYPCTTIPSMSPVSVPIISINHSVSSNLIVCQKRASSTIPRRDASHISCSLQNVVMLHRHLSVAFKLHRILATDFPVAITRFTDPQTNAVRTHLYPRCLESKNYKRVSPMHEHQLGPHFANVSRGNAPSADLASEQPTATVCFAASSFIPREGFTSCAYALTPARD